MKIFISWSGARSKLVATALTKWLPFIFQDVEPWMSDHDIYAGSRWSNELDGVLESTSFGILCLTPENLDSSWMLFEAGCLAKFVKVARVVPYRLDLAATDIEPPLAQFQGVDADEQGTFKLVVSINVLRDSSLSKDMLQHGFDKFWPDLAYDLSKILKPQETSVRRRSDRELLEEALQILRLQQTRLDLIREVTDEDDQKTHVLSMSSLPYSSYYVGFDNEIVRVDSLYKKIKIPATFLNWQKFTLLFWVEITGEFFQTHNNRYLFSYTTNVDGSTGYPNGFYLGLTGRSTEWRFVVKGTDPKNATEFKFSSSHNLLGWRLFSVRWDQAEKNLDFSVDGGHVFQNTHKIEPDYWPEYNPKRQFHLGGWQDNWAGGLSELRFYNFRVYEKYLSNRDLETVLDKEGHLLRTV